MKLANKVMLTELATQSSELLPELAVYKKTERKKVNPRERTGHFMQPTYVQVVCLFVCFFVCLFVFS